MLSEALRATATCCFFLLPALAANTPAWIEKSDRNAQLLLDVQARFEPETAGRLGVQGVDEKIVDLKPEFVERNRDATREALGQLESRKRDETDPLVREDLDILIDAAQKSIRESELSQKYYFPYFAPTRIVFGGIRALLDEQMPQARREKALVRLRRYAGMEDGYTPIARLAQDRISERMRTPGLLGPSLSEVKRDLSDAQFLLDGIPQLFEKYKIEGYQPAFNRLKQQFGDFNRFVVNTVLPRARSDFRLPPEMYAFELRNFGVDMPADELRAKAHAAFTQIQDQMSAVAQQVAKARGWKETGYRDVIRRLKQEQLSGSEILPHYQKRLAEIEGIIRREHLVTLPERPAIIRLASPAETAAQPAPHMVPPPLIGNTGQRGAFVLPLGIAASKGPGQSYDDFTFAAASWTLTAHEARPGHELQFDKMVEKGVSIARGVFAFNSANVEGWGLYAEWITQPFMPPEGQLISLQHRLMRAARAFLDPELHAGVVNPDEARRVLEQDVMLSAAMTTQETERYMFRAPAQATSYFYGYTRLMELRDEVQKALGNRFNQQRFHDFILAQGLLPPALMRKAVFEEFVPR